jgi:hypothetical protein
MPWTRRSVVRRAVVEIEFVCDVVSGRGVGIEQVSFRFARFRLRAALPFAGLFEMRVLGRYTLLLVLVLVL